MRALALVLFVPQLCLAQVGSFVTAKLSSSDSVVRSTGDCEDLVQVTWNTQVSGVPCSDLTFWLAEGECAETPPAQSDASFTRFTPVPLSTWSAQNQGTFTFRVKELPLFKSESCGGAKEKTYRLCAHFQYGSFTCDSKSNAKMSSPPTITYDGVAPEVPTIDGVDEQDSALTIAFSAPSDATLVRIELREHLTADFVEKAAVAASLGRVKVTQLSNGTTYDVQARAEDAAGNVSEPSELAVGTPRRTEGFFTRYRRASGTVGCFSAPGLSAGLPFVLLLFRRRR